ncbi:MAG TPA: hypothetical protein ENK28_03485 [Aliiroseovarius sp.]|nr:hypothetical protein [Aliiroseovarius sp.]
MNVPALNQDETRGFQLACSIMQLEGALMENSQFPAETIPCSNHKLTASQAHREAGRRMRETAEFLEALSIP